MKRRPGKPKNICIVAIGCGSVLLMLTFFPLKVLLTIAAVILILIGCFLLFCC